MALEAAVAQKLAPNRKLERAGGFDQERIHHTEKTREAVGMFRCLAPANA